MLETFLELTIASLLGITLPENILALEMTDLDILSYYTAYIVLIIGSLFMGVSICATTCFARPVVSIRIEQLKRFDSWRSSIKLTAATSVGTSKTTSVQEPAFELDKFMK